MKPVPGLSIEQQPEAVVVRMALCGEARGEQDAGGSLEASAMLAVLWVAANRRLSPRRWPDTLKEVFLQPWQFSCFNGNDANRAKLLDLWQTDPVSWERADTVADLFALGLTVDPTGGANHYVVTGLWGNPTPPGHRVQWYHQLEIEVGRTQERARIGGHVFATA